MSVGAGSDVKDILEIGGGSGEKEFITKDALMNSDKSTGNEPRISFANSVDPDERAPREPCHHETVESELLQFHKQTEQNLIRQLLQKSSDLGVLSLQRDGPPLIPTDTNQGYKQMKAKIGSSRVRPWKWMPFTNPARKDGAIFHHWRRVADEGKDYPFARFNKQPEVPVYSDLEYQQHLHDDNWTRQETDHLFDLCKRFSLRFVVIQDRWNKERYANRSVEDLKERYYNICNKLVKVRAPQGTEPKIRAFDAEHERKRKAQLIKLFNRTTEQVEEEENLIAELKKIELRKKEREKKTQDLQKLITAADSNIDSRKADKKKTNKKVQQHAKLRETPGQTPETTGIKFPDFKQPGVYVRSQKMKLPASVGQKKTKAIEQVLEELGIEYNPVPTEEIVHHFNELRQDIVLLYELKLALATCDYELETLKHQYETLNPGKTPDVPQPEVPDPLVEISIGHIDEDTQSKDPIDVVGSLTPNRKRKAALESSTAQLFKKIKQKV